MRQRLLPARLAALASFISAVALGACASGSPPTSEIAHARTAIERAEGDGAAQLASAPLQTAQSKLSRAQAASQDKDYVQAQRLAEQAEADADYAGAVARAQRAQRTVSEMQLLEQRRAMPTGR